MNKIFYVILLIFILGITFVSAADGDFCTNDDDCDYSVTAWCDDYFIPYECYTCTAAGCGTGALEMCSNKYIGLCKAKL